MADVAVTDWSAVSWTAGNVYTQTGGNDNRSFTVGANTVTLLGRGNATLISFVDPMETSWTLESGEVYYTSHTTNLIPFLLEEDGNLLTPELHYADDVATIVAALARGEWTVRNADDRIYYRASDGAAPGTHTLRRNQRLDDAANGIVIAVGRSHVVIDGFYLRLVTWNGGDAAGIHLTNCTAPKVTNCYANDCRFGYWIDGGAGALLKGVTASDCVGSGFSVEAVTSDLTNCTISYSYFSRNGYEPNYQGSTHSFNSDGDGIGIGHGGGSSTGLEIRDCYFKQNGPRYTTDAEIPADVSGTVNRGAGIIISTANAMDVELDVRRCIFDNNHRYALFLGNEWKGGDIISNVFMGNGNDSAYTVKSVLINTPAAGTKDIVYNHNTHNGDTTPSAVVMSNTDAAQNYSVQNCIFSKTTPVAPAVQYVELDVTAATANYTVNNNCFNPTDTNQVVAVSTTTYTSATFDAAWGPSGTKGTNNIIADPLFLSATDSRLNGDSPCIAAGTAWWTASAATYGSELVTNGTFDANIDSWDVLGVVATLSWQATGRARLTNGEVQPATAFSDQTITVTNGGMYRFQCDGFIGTAGDWRVRVTDGVATTYIDITSSSDTSVDQTFCPTNTSIVIFFDTLATSSTSEYIEFDNVSLKEQTGGGAMACAPHGEDGLRFYETPSMGAYEVRTDKPYTRAARAYPVRILGGGVDIAKARRV